jgi:DNA-directed RNA polymerase subunit RPC12/RpoP
MLATAPSLSKQRGVHCRHCGGKISVPNSIIARESAFKDEHPNDTQKFGSKVFSLRCKRCGGETVYPLNQIADID